MEILMDFDGTLMQDSTFDFGWLIATARHYGFSSSEETARTLLRDCTTDFEVFGSLRLSGSPDPFTAELLEQNMKNLDRARWHPGLPQVIRSLSRHHTLFVLSNRDQASLEEGVRRLGCETSFRASIGARAGLRGKPSLELYAELRLRWPQESDRVVHVGDKPDDAAFADRAGIRFVGACWYRDELGTGSHRCRSIKSLPRILEHAAEA